MAVDLICPNCSDNLGKDVENPKVTYCDTCGQDNIKNPRGYKEEDDWDKVSDWADLPF